MIDQTICDSTSYPKHKGKLIAIIDDNEAVQDSLRDLIEAAGFEARCFGSAVVFLNSDSYGKVAALIIDVLMPEMSGFELQSRLKAERLPVPLIFITAHEDPAMRAQAIGQGAAEFFTKPFCHTRLLDALRTALDTKEA